MKCENLRDFISENSNSVPLFSFPPRSHFMLSASVVWAGGFGKLSLVLWTLKFIHDCSTGHLLQQVIDHSLTFHPIFYMHTVSWASQVVLAVKNTHANAAEVRDMGSILESGRSPGERHGNPLQYSCLENPEDRGAWRATVQRVTHSWTWPKQLSKHAYHFIVQTGLWPVRNPATQQKVSGLVSEA